MFLISGYECSFSYGSLFFLEVIFLSCEHSILMVFACSTLYDLISAFGENDWNLELNLNFQYLLASIW